MSLMAKGPQFTRYILPILHSLREMGGSATAAEVTDAVIERERLPEELLEQTNKNGQSKVKNQIAWARMYLVHSGHIDSSVRGVWRLTDKGQHEDLAQLNVSTLFKGVQETFKPNSSDEVSDKVGTTVEAAEIKLEAEETFSCQSSKALAPKALSVSVNAYFVSMAFRMCGLLAGLEMVELMAKASLRSIRFSALRFYFSASDIMDLLDRE